MARLINNTFLVSERQLPSDITPDRLNLFIDKYQEELLADILGYRLYKAFVAEVDASLAATPVPLAGRMKDLRDGADYTDASGRLRRWIGLVDTGKRRSLIANYVYYWWLRDTASRTSSQGEKADKSAGSDNVSPATKMCRAWNEMSLWIEELITYLQAEAGTFPEFAEADLVAIRCNYRPINAMNI